ncbi:MAG: glutaredoxin 3 [Candidatus Binatia bacterium]
MVEVTIYTSMACPYCVQAKRLLDHKGIVYTEINVSLDPTRRAEMIQASGRRTVPQIFIGGQAIGGFDDLYELDQAGKLDALLNPPA